MEGTDARQFGSASSPANQESVVVCTSGSRDRQCSLWNGVGETLLGLAAPRCCFHRLHEQSNRCAGRERTVGHAVVCRPQGQQWTRHAESTFPGETIGPYVSQLFVTPTNFGQQELAQQLTPYLPGIDYMTDLTTWQEVQNGIDTGLRNQPDLQPRFLHNRRGLAAYTHVDVLYQAYFTAFLVLNTLGAPLNPGNPYVHSRTQNGFCTLGGPDIASSIGGIAARALDVVWYQK
jgi:hypothetical protein